MQSLFRNSFLSDVNLILINNIEQRSLKIPAHKAILANRSEYFRGLFNNFSLPIDTDNKNFVTLDLTEIGSLEVILYIIQFHIYGTNLDNEEEEFIYRNLDMINYLLIEGNTFEPETLQDQLFTTDYNGNYITFHGPIQSGYITTAIHWNLLDNELYFEFDNKRKQQLLNFILSYIPDISSENYLTSNLLRFEIIHKDYVKIILYQLYTLKRISQVGIVKKELLKHGIID